MGLLGPWLHLVVIAPVSECVAEIDIYLVVGEAPTLGLGLCDKSFHSGEGQTETSETVCLFPLLCSPDKTVHLKKPYPILEGR